MRNSQKYDRFIKALRILVANGFDDTDSDKDYTSPADVLRDYMDDLWWQMMEDKKGNDED